MVHMFIFWGFLVLQIETIEYVIRAFLPDFSLGAYVGISAYNGIMGIQDIFGLIVLLAVTIAFIRRFGVRPKHSVASLDAAVILLLIGGLMVTKFLANGAHVTMAFSGEELGWDRGFTPVAAATAGWLFGGGYRGEAAPPMAGAVYHFSHVVHIAIVCLFANWIPRGKHTHVLTAMPNVFFRKLERQGALYPLDLEDEDAETFGAGKIEDLSWKQLMDTYTCTECGRCEHYCPAYNTGKALNPMMIIHKLQTHMREKGEHVLRDGLEDNFPPLAGGIISAEELWACTTCGACVQACPVFIEHVDTIVDMRRYLTLTEATFPPEVGRTFRNMENSSNPWGIPKSQRADWREVLDFEVPYLKDCEEPPEYLFWVGCAGSFDDRQKKVTVAIARLLHAAGVSFAILGEEEGCTGDPARRIGNEYLYLMLASENVETLNDLNVVKIVTGCPHCFHTVGKEYPQLGGDFEVVHHSHLLKDLIDQGRLKLNGGATPQRVTYHDSCYIGRWNSEYDSPRDVLNAAGGIDLVEMDLNREKSFCCGAGGGRMWMEEEHGKRINVERTDQALSKNPDTIAVACPFCMTMITDGVAHRGAEESVRTRDIAEILADCL
jgi:Fe-S oxidoreductase